MVVFIFIQILIEHSVSKQNVTFDQGLFAYVPEKRMLSLYGLMISNFCLIFVLDEKCSFLRDIVLYSTCTCS